MESSEVQYQELLPICYGRVVLPLINLAFIKLFLNILSKGILSSHWVGFNET